MAQKGFACHELRELHKLLTAEIAVVQKMQAAVGQVEDAEIKSLIEASLAVKCRRISQMEELLSKP
ncbi:MAG: hypothetical protein P4N59_21495 [Negativicutes bacterium]|nr:hypothetical protein [Negativicutes bacterium]